MTLLHLLDHNLIILFLMFHMFHHYPSILISLASLKITALQFDQSEHY